MPKVHKSSHFFLQTLFFGVAYPLFSYVKFFITILICYFAWCERKVIPIFVDKKKKEKKTHKKIIRYHIIHIYTYTHNIFGCYFFSVLNIFEYMNINFLAGVTLAKLIQWKGNTQPAKKNENLFNYIYKHYYTSA